MTVLSELLNANLPEGWNGKRLSEEADKLGFVLHRATAANYLRGVHAKVPDEVTLQAFAKTLNIPLAKLREAVGLSTVDEVFELPPEANRLTKEQRDAVRHVISVMLNPGKGGVGNAEHPAPIDEVAARRRGGKPEEVPQPDLSRVAASRRRKPPPNRPVTSD